MDKQQIWIKQLEIAWNNFERRRSYQWKINLALWGAIGAFILITLKENTVKINSSIYLFLVGGIVVLVHFWFLFCVTRKNNIDKEIAKLYEDELNVDTSICGRRFGEVQGVEDNCKEVRKAINKRPKRSWWSPAFSTFITANLIVLAGFVLHGETTALSKTSTNTHQVMTNKGNKYEIQSKGKDYYEVKNWDPNCPLDRVFRFTIHDLTQFINRKDPNKAEMLQLLWAEIDRKVQ